MGKSLAEAFNRLTQSSYSVQIVRIEVKGDAISERTEILLMAKIDYFEVPEHLELIYEVPEEHEA
jgi:hypothetical protein